jgi:hypothetical protein
MSDPHGHVRLPSIKPFKGAKWIYQEGCSADGMELCAFDSRKQEFLGPQLLDPIP